jgi:nitrogen-specific signal transduction histidine kinase/ActR/RegA family two-component response regulator
VSIRASGELERLYEEEKRKSLELQLLQSQKMESVGRLAGGVAHDFNNMLQVILGNAYLAFDEVSDDSSVKQSLIDIIESGNRSADLTRKLLTFARKQIVLPQVINLNDVTMVMLKMLKVLIGENINVSRIIGNNLWPVKVDPSQIDQILVNLCVNARDAINDIGIITIETKNCTLDNFYFNAHAGLIPGEYVCISVSDNGCGMDKETMEHIFEPFFTTKEFGKGTGLGLATVYGAVKQNNGYIYAYSELGKGTTFTIFFPRYIDVTISAENTTEKKPVPGGNETILLVEDESSILKLANRMLTQIGYNILLASSPGEAIQIANAYADQINLLITDVIMPDMNGYDLSQQLITVFPKMKVLYMSGYTSDVIAERGVLEEGMHFLQKPFSLGDIAVKVREVLGED